MVELGNGKRFFFDFGPGCLRNILAMQVPLQMVNDIFLTHLHVDHYGELPYLFAFAPWAARWKPLRVHVTKDAIWTRTAALSEGANPARPSPSEAKGLFDLGPTHLSVDFPDPRHNVSDVQEPFVREKEIDPNLYYPQDVKRDLVRVFPRGFKIEIPKMVAEKLGERVKSRLGRN
jgi:ribonuclease BN (tRNA processing enzyme)